MNLNVNDNDILTQQESGEEVAGTLPAASAGGEANNDATNPSVEQSVQEAEQKQSPDSEAKPAKIKQNAQLQNTDSSAPRPRRVGTFTLGIALIVTGLVMALLLFQPGFNLELLLWMPPAILITLGVEILLRYCFSKNHTYKYDILSAFVCFLLICGSIGAASIPKLIEYWGPQRYQAQETYNDELYDLCYEALKDQGNISSLSIYSDMNYNGSEFTPYYTRLDIHFVTPYETEEALAAAVKGIMDSLNPLNADWTNISFSGSNEELECSLNLNGKFQYTMDADNLAKLANIEWHRDESDLLEQELPEEPSSEAASQPESVESEQANVDNSVDTTV